MFIVIMRPCSVDISAERGETSLQCVDKTVCDAQRYTSNGRTLTDVLNRYTDRQCLTHVGCTHKS